MASRPSLPVTRIHTIMKSTPDSDQVSKESAQIMAKLAEFFIKMLSEKGYKHTNNGKKLDYKHIVQVVHADDRFEFLRDMIPKKITVAEYKRILARKNKNGDDHDRRNDTDSTDGDEDASESESDEDSNAS